MIIEELEIFLQDLKKYKKALDTYGSDNDLVEELIRKQGNYEAVITELTGSPVLVPVYKGTCNPVNMWSEALRISPGIQTDTALGFCIETVLKAIGKLKDDIEKGKRDKETGGLIKMAQAFSSEAPKAFIAHGGSSPALRKLKEFLDAIGVQPLVVEEQASEDRSVAENVDWYSKLADCAIILATKGDIDGKAGGFIPRGNVLMEVGKLQHLFKGRIIYLLQSNTKFPTNVSEKVWARFSPQSMDNSFIKIARELRAFGILKTIQPLEGSKE